MGLDSITSFFSGVPTDWLILGGFAILAALDCLRAGARHIATLALALPIATLVFSAIPNTAYLGTLVGQFEIPFFEAILFLIISIVFYVLISKIGLSWGEESGQTIQAALAGVAGTVIVVVFWLQIPALDALWYFSPTIQAIFGSSYQALWLIGSYAALAFVRG